jgi:hypothetical protein
MFAGTFRNSSSGFIDWLTQRMKAAGAFNGLPRELRHNMQRIYRTIEKGLPRFAHDSPRVTLIVTLPLAFGGRGASSTYLTLWGLRRSRLSSFFQRPTVKVAMDLESLFVLRRCCISAAPSVNHPALLQPSLPNCQNRNGATLQNVILKTAPLMSPP